MAPASHPAKPAAAPGIRLLPLFLRNFVRNREIGLVLVAIVVGLLSGVLVAAISSLSQVSHALLFDIPFDAHLSATGVISWQRTLLVPMIGGLVLALIGLYFARRVKGQQLADAIEANALYGGRVSFRGSLLISIQTLLSNGFGGSVGLEAGYNQICSMFGSHVGQRLAAVATTCGYWWPAAPRGRSAPRFPHRSRAPSTPSRSCSAPIRPPVSCRSSPAPSPHGSSRGN
ncbi:hypothetical protein GGD64_000137 [Bradyrhizobium sp. CIR3A]|nr:hypothetical protein [Bradyrhizobium sp. CIR3A]NYG48312.1 hypothetical protein [Bradyrhizobium sp. IAR9]